MSLRPVVAGCLLALSASLVPGSAQAWSSTPRPLDPSGWITTGGQEIATSARGGAAATWLSWPPGALGPALRFRRILPHVATRTRSVPTGEGSVRTASLALDADGDALIAWSAAYEVDGLSGGRVYARRLSRSGVLGPILTLGSAASISDGPSVALAPSGRGAVVYTETDQTRTTRQLIRRIPLSGKPSAPQTIGSSESSQPLVVATPQGDFLALAANHDGVLRAYRWRKDGTMAKRRVSPDDAMSHLPVAIGTDADGGAHVSYESQQQGVAPSLWARTWTRAGVLSPARRVSRAGDRVLHAAAATDAQGDTMLSWSVQPTSGRTTLHARILRRDGSLGAVQAAGAIRPEYDPISDPSPPPVVAVDSDGDGVLTWWTEPEWGHRITWVRRISPSGALGTKLRLDDSASTGGAAMTPRGRALVGVIDRDNRGWLYTGP